MDGFPATSEQGSLQTEEQLIFAGLFSLCKCRHLCQPVFQL